jgi:hypothetical protein
MIPKLETLYSMLFDETPREMAFVDCKYIGNIMVDELSLAGNNIGNGLQYLVNNQYQHINLGGCEITDFRYLKDIDCKDLVLENTKMTNDDYHWLRYRTYRSLLLYGTMLSPMKEYTNLEDIRCDMLFIGLNGWSDRGNSMTDISSYINLPICHSLHVNDYDISYIHQKYMGINFVKLTLNDNDILIATEIYVRNMNIRLSETIQSAKLRQCIIDYFI